jgi:hypothetical protein
MVGTTGSTAFCDTLSNHFTRRHLMEWSVRLRRIGAGKVAPTKGSTQHFTAME